MPFSIMICHWSLLAFILNWLIGGHWRKKAEWLTINKLWWIMPMFFVLHLAGMLYTSYSASGWSQIETKAAFLLVPVALASTERLSRSEFGLIVRVFILSCLAATLYCVGHAAWSGLNNVPVHNFSNQSFTDYMQFNPDVSPSWMAFSYISLAAGVNLHPTYFGLYLTFCILLLLYFFRSEETNARDKSIGITLIVFFLLFILFLSSRIATLAAVAAVLSSLPLRAQPFSWGRVLALQALAILVIIAVVYANPVSRYRDMQEPLATSLTHVPDHATRSIETRLSLLRLTRFAGTDVNPLIGSGTGSAEQRLREVGESHGISNVLGSYDPHNQFIYTFLDLGLVGVVGLLAMFVVPLIGSLKRKSRVYAGLLLVFAAVCLTESALELQKGIVLFTFFGSLLGFHETTPQTRAEHHGK
jgi:O-antigen ligase